MMTPESHRADHERRLDEIVLSYLKAREDRPNLDQETWLDRYPELKEELTSFFQDQERIDRLTKTLGLVTDATQPPTNFATIAWGEADSSLPPMALECEQVLGDYELLEQIGKGGMGTVYKARQRSLKRIVALKMILAGAHASEEELARFRSEAEAVARLQHPNIVQIYEVGEVDRMAFFSLEYVEGGSLADNLHGTPLPPRAAAQLMQTLAEAIHFAHQQGIIHRDLKPANVLLHKADPETGRQSDKETQRRSAANLSASSGRAVTLSPKITDFGLAKRLDDDSAQTKSGTIMGTPSYMAPEQAAGHAYRVGPPTDIYGLGAILYELLTGRPPFKAATPWETINQVLHNEPVSPRLLDPQVDRDLETICLKCLQKDPHQRYLSAQAMADDLHCFLEDRPIAARPVGNAVKLWRLCRRHPGTATSLALALLSLLILMIVIVVFNRQLQHQLQHNEAMNHELQMTLTKQVANRIDSDLRQLSRIPHLMATTLSVRDDWREGQMGLWMEQMLRKDERLFGTCVALEPRQFDGQHEDFALYTYRAKQGIQTQLLDPRIYKPHYREWSWYSEPKQQKRALWSEPYIDVGGGDIPMITYSVPIWRGETFAGVVTADLSIAYFDAMRKWLDEVKLGKQGYAFVISPSGTFISHPDPALQMPRKISETPAFQEGEALSSLTTLLLKRETGSVRAVDPFTGKQSIFFFAPIASAQWSFIAVTEE